MALLHTKKACLTKATVWTADAEVPQDWKWRLLIFVFIPAALMYKVLCPKQMPYNMLCNSTKVNCSLLTMNYLKPRGSPAWKLQPFVHADAVAKLNTTQTDLWISPREKLPKQYREGKDICSLL